MKKVLQIVILLSVVFNFNCTNTKKLRGSKDDGIIEITFLHINDVYEIAPLEGGKTGGLARVETLHKQLLQENKNTLFVHAGDFLNPSLIGTMRLNGEKIRGKQMVEVLNAMDLDVVTFGNHEFDLKEQELQKRLNESDFTWLGTNVFHKTGDKIEPFYRINTTGKIPAKDYFIWEVEDADGTKAKIGIFGATVNSNPKEWIVYDDFYKKAKEAYKTLEPQVDFSVGLTHINRVEDIVLASMLPDVPLIMGGHDHTNSIDTVGNAIVAKADANAKTVYVHRLKYNKKTKKVKVKSELIPITDVMADDPQVAVTVKKWQEIQDEKIMEIWKNPNEVIYHTETPLDALETSIRYKQTNFGNIVTAAMSAAAKEPVHGAILNGGSIRIDDKLDGDITAIDIFRALPFGGSIYEIELNGPLLQKVLDVGRENKGTGGYLQLYDISYDDELNKWRIDGDTLKPCHIYKIAISDFLMSGREYRLDFLNEMNEEVFFVIKPEKDDLSDLRTDIRKAVIDYMRKM